MGRIITPEVTQKIHQMEDEITKTFFPEFEKPQYRALGLVVELVCIRLLVRNVVDKNSQATAMENMIQAGVYRSLDAFDAFEKELLTKRITDEKFMRPLIESWMARKGEIGRYLNEQDDGDPA